MSEGKAIIKAVGQVTYVTEGQAITFELGAVSVDLLAVLQDVADAQHTCQSVQAAAALCERLQYLPPIAPGERLLDALHAEAARLRPLVKKLIPWDRNRGARAVPFTEEELEYVAARAVAVRGLVQHVDPHHGGSAVTVRLKDTVSKAGLPWFALQVLYKRLVDHSVRASVAADYIPMLPTCRVCGGLLPSGRRALCGSPACLREDTRRRVQRHRQRRA